MNARISFTRCTYGGDARPGWVVRFGGSLIAVLYEGDNGEVGLKAGLEIPFIGVGITWSSLAEAKAYIEQWAGLYRSLSHAQLVRVYQDMLDAERGSTRDRFGAVR
jgi:hypothetical protein